MVEELTSEEALRIIQEKLPQVSSLIQDQGVDANPVDIHNDLKSLQWLEPENTLEIIEPIWDIIDKCATCAAEGSVRYRILKINSIKMKLNNLIYELTNSGQGNSEWIWACKRRAQNLKFFSLVKETLDAKSDDTAFSTYFVNAHDTFKDFKATLSMVFMHLDKFISRELSKSMKDLLDEQFNEQVIKPHKTRLSSLEDTKMLITDYDRSFTQARSTFNASTSSGGYWTADAGTSSYASTYKENVYLGELDESERKWGYGKMTYSTDDVYEGAWQNNKPHGEGVYIWRDGGRYEGTLEDGLPHGFGRRQFSSGNKYNGEWREGKKHGKGAMDFVNGDLYEGDWANDEMHGVGYYRWYTGDEYRGGFKNDKRHGQGVLQLSSEESIEGTWEDGKMTNESI